MLGKEKITIGQLAEQANVSVRTLQYYDKIGLLKAAAISEGGRRLYNTNDITMVHQIITLKSLGLTLKEIEQRMIPIDSNEDIVAMLNRQSTIIEEQISQAGRLLESIEMLKKEIEESKNVDWEKYSNMVKLIQDNNEYYWVINYLEKDILSSISKLHDSNTNDLPIEWLKTCFVKIDQIEKSGKTPESHEAQDLADEWWQLIQKYTKGDARLITQLYEFYKRSSEWPLEFGQIKETTKQFFEKAIAVYMDKNKLQVSDQLILDTPNNDKAIEKGE